MKLHESTRAVFEQVFKPFVCKVSGCIGKPVVSRSTFKAVAEWRVACQHWTANNDDVHSRDRIPFEIDFDFLIELEHLLIRSPLSEEVKEAVDAFYNKAD